LTTGNRHWIDRLHHSLCCLWSAVGKVIIIVVILIVLVILLLWNVLLYNIIVGNAILLYPSFGFNY